MPGTAGAKLPEVAEPPATAFVEVKTWAVQVALLNRRKVTVPVGLAPPATVAVSVSAVPTGPPAEAWVEMVGVTGPADVMLTDSLAALQGEVAGLLTPSPEYAAVHRYVPAVAGTKLVEV